MWVKISIFSGIIFLIYIINSLFIFCVYSKSAITYHMQGGRFGDKVVLWGRAKVLSVQYGIPLFYKPFPYSDKLVMHRNEIRHSMQVEKNFRKHVQVKNAATISRNTEDSVLFFFGFFIPLNSSLNIDFHLHEFFFADTIYEKMILYPECRNAIQSMLQPIIPRPRFNLPLDRVSVAVHVRKGGGVDLGLHSPQIYKVKKFADEFWPLKFPPEQFYIDQIKKLSTILNDVPMYVFILTDDKNP